MTMKPLSGRVELLQWINTLCVANYGSVGHLNDGVLYITVIEMLTGGATGCPPFLHKTPSFDCNCDDYGDDAVVASPAGGSGGGGGPMLNARALSDRREANFRFLETLMRTSVPQKWCLQLQPQRLAQAKLQDHIHLLSHLHKWFCSTVSASTGNKLRFVHDPVARRYAASEGKPLSLSLQIPSSAAVREQHARFVASLPESAFAPSSSSSSGMVTVPAQQQFQRQHAEEEEKRQLQKQVAAFSRSATAQPSNKFFPVPAVAVAAADLSEFPADLEEVTIDVNRELDSAAQQLEFRRQQLERDSAALKKMLQQRDALQARLRRAYATIQRDIEDNVDDGSHGFRADIHRMFSDTAAGRGVFSPSQVLAAAMMMMTTVSSPQKQ